LRGTITRPEIQETLRINKTRFFALLKEYRQAPESFSIAYERSHSPRLSVGLEEAIQTELQREQALIENPQLPISSYNYSAVRDRLADRGYVVSVNTIIQRAKQLGCYIPHPKKKIHDRQVVTAAIGALIQHDASTHLWSPYASEKWTLITSIDDYSRLLLYADFTDDVDPQWRTCLRTLGVDVTYALSPEAKGKVERPYRWLRLKGART